MDQLAMLDQRVNDLAIKTATDIVALQTLARRAAEDRVEQAKAIEGLARKIDDVATSFGRYEASARALTAAVDRNATASFTSFQKLIALLMFATAIIVPLIASGKI